MTTDTQGGDKKSGLFAALRNIATTMFATGKTRLELLSNEIEEAKLRALRALMLAQALMFCLGLGILLALAFVTVLFWEQRLLILAIFSALFFALSTALYARFKRTAQHSEPAFAASIAELQEDLRQLKEAAGYESKDE